DLWSVGTVEGPAGGVRVHNGKGHCLREGSIGPMSTQAKGTFEVKLAPQETYSKDPSLARMSIDKQFHGDLEGTSIGEMLSAGSPVKGSAGYVAIEKVTGTLQGLRGTFVLQHFATMTR